MTCRGPIEENPATRKTRRTGAVASELHPECHVIADSLQVGRRSQVSRKEGRCYILRQLRFRNDSMLHRHVPPAMIDHDDPNPSPYRGMRRIPVPDGIRRRARRWALAAWDFAPIAIAFVSLTAFFWLIYMTLVAALSPPAPPKPPEMKLPTSLVTCALSGALNITWSRHEALAPSPLPASHAASDGEQIIELFQDLGRSTVWKSIANISLEGDTFEPEGMLRLGDDRYVLSCGEYTESTVKYPTITDGTDRTAGAGFAHLMVYNGKGERIADATLTKEGDIEYHNGGIDFDGEYIWGTIAQYRPNSTAYAYRTSPKSLEPQKVLNYHDHLGGIVHDTSLNTITALNWGSRNASTWDLNRAKTGCKATPRAESVVRNPSYFVDYQDCKWLGHSKFYGGKSVMLCSGVATIGTYNLGGVALVDVATMVPLAEVPIVLTSALGVPLTQNPVDVSVVDGKLRFYWVPDQHNSTLYIYEAQPDSPFEFGGGSQ